VKREKKEVDGRKIFEDNLTTMSMREMMGCIPFLLLIMNNKLSILVNDTEKRDTPGLDFHTWKCYIRSEVYPENHHQCRRQYV
jgi:hypothetical protein